MGRVYLAHLVIFVQESSPKDRGIIILAQIQHTSFLVVKIVEIASEPHRFAVVNHSTRVLADRIHWYVEVKNGFALDNVAQFLNLCTTQAGETEGDVEGGAVQVEGNRGRRGLGDGYGECDSKTLLSESQTQISYRTFRYMHWPLAVRSSVV